MIVYLFIFIYGMITMVVTPFLTIHTIYMLAGGYDYVKENGRKRPQIHGGTDGKLEICCLLNEASIVLCV
jgi:hypothetical protein